MIAWSRARPDASQYAPTESWFFSRCAAPECVARLVEEIAIDPAATAGLAIWQWNENASIIEDALGKEKDEQVREWLTKALALSRTPLAELWRHPLHTREIGSQLTNVLRCLYLEANGYQVTVTELVGWEHSLKNELILGRRVKRFDANTYLYPSRALSYFDLARQHGGGDLLGGGDAADGCVQRPERLLLDRRRHLHGLAVEDAGVHGVVHQQHRALLDGDVGAGPRYAHALRDVPPCACAFVAPPVAAAVDKALRAPIATR